MTFSVNFMGNNHAKIPDEGSESFGKKITSYAVRFLKRAIRVLKSPKTVSQ